MKPTWTLLPDIDVPPNPPRDLAWEQAENMRQILGDELWEALERGEMECQS